MLKLMNLCFIIFFVLGLSSSKMMNKSTTEIQTKTGRSNCWVYATTADQYLQHAYTNITIGFVNKKTLARKNLVYSTNETLCNIGCRKNSGMGCFSTYSYDIHFGIPKDSYVCWFNVTCPKYFNRVEYDQQDTSIFHLSSYKCGFLCDAIYRQEGRCLKRPATEQEKKDKKVDENYYCYFRGPINAFQPNDIGPVRPKPVNQTNTSVNATKF